jgi:DNA helicase IV
MNLDKLKEIIKAEIKSIKEEEAEMKPKILDISPEQDETTKQLANYDEPNYDSTYYYTGMQGKS